MKVKKDIMKTSITVSSAVSTTLLAAPSFAATLEGVPQFDRQFVIMMENHSYSQIIGNPNAPYINQLASTYNLATNYFGTTHPSLPNYIATISGSEYGNGAPFDANGFPDVNGGNDNPPSYSIGAPGAPTAVGANCVAGSPTQNCDAPIAGPSIVRLSIPKES